MRSSPRSSVTLLSFALLSLVLPTEAQTPPPARYSVPANPKDLQVKLTIGDGTHATYHIGELIPAHISFTSTDHTIQRVSTERCESMETFPDTSTPESLPTRELEDKAAMRFHICSGHGWTAQIDLAEKPWILDITLNHRYLLDIPGTYNLTWNGKSFGHQVSSNAVSLTILPRDPVWEASELARADTLIDGPPAQRNQGCEILRYLGTPAAALDMARRYTGSYGCDQSFSTALINAKSRDEILTILEKKIAAPEQVITSDYLQTLALISLYRAHPEWYPTQSVRSTPYTDHVGPIWHRSLLMQEQLRYTQLLVAALPLKSPPTRAACIESLFQFAQYHELPPTINAALQQQMPSVFRSLGDFDQNSVLRNLWPSLSSPIMIPLLVDLIENDGNPTLRGLALRRLAEIAPDKARPYVLRDIKAPRLSFPIEELGVLPDPDLPELDPFLLQHINDQLPNPDGADLHGDLILLRRYGSPAIEPQVRTLFDENFSALDCGERFDLMAYLHRVDPSAAEAFFPRLRFAQGNPQCSIQALATRFWSPSIEKTELTQLDDPDPREITSALNDLQRYASPAARPVILLHLQLWNALWKSKPTPDPNPPDDPSAILDNAYLHTLFFAYGWNTSLDEIVSLNRLCVSATCINAAKQLADSYHYQHTFIVLGSNAEGPGAFNYGFAPYGDIGDLQRMETKISQFPPGTTFSFDTRQHREVTIRTVVDTLGTWMTAHGYTLTLYRDPPSP